MIFGLVQVAAAEGAILAHTTRLPGRVLRKGRVLDAEDVALLARAGQAEILVARLHAGDVAEDAAAGRLAAALCRPGLEVLPAKTGRANLAAAGAGLLRVDAATINALNGLHEGLTLATLADAAVVGAHGLLATVKVIPFALPGTVLDRAEAVARAAPALRLCPFRPLRVGMALTTLPGVHPRVLEATVAATAARIRALTGVMLPPVLVAHARDAIAGALAGLIGQGAELLLIAGASATVDRCDVAPAAIVQAGGAISHFGMPVDPGNLLCLGAIGAVPAIVLPGCARSPRLNGIDAVLRLLFAGEPVGRAEIAAMGVGGLLEEAVARPAPRLQVPRRRVAGVLLAAGRSSRMGGRNKLLIADAQGVPMVARVADALLASGAAPVVAVLGHQAGAVAAALAGRNVACLENADFAAGMAGSLRVGLAALPRGVTAAVICLGDMPLVTGELLARLIAAYDPARGRLIVVPTCQGKRGNPVLWDRAYFAEMAALEGDMGARALVLKHAAQVVEVEVGDDAVLRDFDTPDSLPAG